MGKGKKMHDSWFEGSLPCQREVDCRRQDGGIVRASFNYVTVMVSNTYANNPPVKNQRFLPAPWRWIAAKRQDYARKRVSRPTAQRAALRPRWSRPGALHKGAFTRLMKCFTRLHVTRGTEGYARIWRTPGFTGGVPFWPCQSNPPAMQGEK